MKWILIIAGIIIGIMVIIYLIGMLLPVKHSATVQDIIPAKPEQVWRRITDVSGFSAWRKNLDSVVVTNDLEWIEVSGSNKTPLRFKERIPAKRLVTSINSKDLPFGGDWVFELEPKENGTLLTITENGEVYNPIFRFMSKYVMGHEGMLKKYLSYLKASFQ